MNVLHYPSSIDVEKDVQIWNNAAFDNGDIIDMSSSSSHSSKENEIPSHSFGLCRSPVCLNSSVKNSHAKPLKVLFKEGLLLNHQKIGNDEMRDVSKIDPEMEDIEKKIRRLSLKLESLRLEKEEINAKKIESSGVSLMPKKIGGILGLSNGSSRKGMSMGPSEIASSVRSQRDELAKPNQNEAQQKKKKVEDRIIKFVCSAFVLYFCVIRLAYQ
ncbi:hypothetical protein AQUCO_11200006v1 [Aquilegia coerulea]|uniref:Uncharacterized protein n=1 Tax=Aquilegia coerulea TaxID=218851 RepID=A0A2G5C3U3_AQUCA|nr:hypothetical protein AQUCO_11200006v1 [Aquilegia coerulea]